MARRESKIKCTTSIDIVGRDGARKGKLELTPGHVHYFRTNAREDNPTLSLTYQQLTALLEREVDFQEIDTSKPAVTRSRMKTDFLFEYGSCAAADDPEFPEFWSYYSSKSSLAKLDPRRVDDGVYQLSQDMQNGRKSKRKHWFAQISVPLALWIVSTYVDKFLANTRDRMKPTKDVVITHSEMRTVLWTLIKKLD